MTAYDFGTGLVGDLTMVLTNPALADLGPNDRLSLASRPADEKNQLWHATKPNGVPVLTPEDKDWLRFCSHLATTLAFLVDATDEGKQLVAEVLMRYGCELADESRSVLVDDPSEPF